ncbi:MAG: hypothetical protein AB1Z50_00690 [Desulfuromonadales bacterium]
MTVKLFLRESAPKTNGTPSQAARETGQPTGPMPRIVCSGGSETRGPVDVGQSGRLLVLTAFFQIAEK